VGSHNLVNRTCAWGARPGRLISCAAFFFGTSLLFSGTSLVAPSALAGDITLADFTALPVWNNNDPQDWAGASGTSDADRRLSVRHSSLTFGVTSTHPLIHETGRA
jgi:hypothetical protein